MLNNTNENITLNEVMNDGTNVHLYYSEMYQEYVAYGYSAFLVSMNDPSVNVKPHVSYSDQFQMPQVRVKDSNLETLKGKMVTVVSEDKYIHLSDTVSVDERKYEEWASMLRG